jgi:hypothetical protein
MVGVGDLVSGSSHLFPAPSLPPTITNPFHFAPSNHRYSLEKVLEVANPAQKKEAVEIIRSDPELHLLSHRKHILGLIE